MIYRNLVKPILFKKDAEWAHEKAIELATKTSQYAYLQTAAKSLFGFESTQLEQELFGCTFPNPVGLAAGFDKNGTTALAMQALGFGFVEVGSITAQASEGNPKPRAFRLPDDHSLINRMGLNNEGTDSIIKRLEKVKLAIPLGINIAKTNDATIHGDAALQDYLYSYEKAQPVADYITINISCPNTGEGKTFEDPAALRDLLSVLEPGQDGKKPTLVKLTVDLDRESLEKLVEICEAFSVAGYVATNTSSGRDGLKTDTDTLQKIGNGGLSGRAIREKSTQVVRWVREIAGPEKPIIGVGGVDHPDAALEKIEAGANLIQLYTGLVYYGPSLLPDIKKRLVQEQII